MRKVLLFLIAIIASVSAKAQDVIVKNDGSTVLCKVVEVNGTDIIYLKWADLKGPRYVMDRSLVSAINYQDGRQDKNNELTSNSYAPGIQQTGDARYNDNALLSLDKAINDKSQNPYYKQAKKLTVIGWVVGGVGVVGGVTAMILGNSWGLDSGNDGMPMLVAGTILTVGGIATTTGCLIRANQLKRQAYTVANLPVLHREFNLGDGVMLSAGIDMIRDNKINQSTLGLGVNFSF